MLYAFPTPSELARRSELRQLSAESTPPPSSFRVRAWRWHHLGVVRDLSRVEETIHRRKTALCSAGASRRPLLDALKYIVNDNWAVHNDVERSLFLPWLNARAGHDGQLARRVRLVEAERERLMDEAQGLLKGVERWLEIGPEACVRDVGGIRDRVKRLRDNAGVLFRASEAVLVPRVVELFTEREQKAFNQDALRRITAKQVRISLVVFGDAVKQQKPVVATKRDREEFESDIPLAIRKWALPYWRNKFVAHKIRFLTGKS